MKLLVIGASSYVGARIYTDLKDDLSTFDSMNLAPKMYKEMIEVIVGEIKYHLHRFAYICNILHRLWV